LSFTCGQYGGTGYSNLSDLANPTANDEVLFLLQPGQELLPVYGPNTKLLANSLKDLINGNMINSLQDAGLNSSLGYFSGCDASWNTDKSSNCDNWYSNSSLLNYSVFNESADTRSLVQGVAQKRQWFVLYTFVVFYLSY